MMKKEKARYPLIDEIRGLAVINMVLFHLLWDLVNVYGVTIAWYEGVLGSIWQKCICFSFILLSGFCSRMGHHRLRRSLTVFACGMAITAVTVVFMPENRIIFGILTFLGTAQLIVIPLEKLIKKTNSFVGMAMSLLLFLLFFNINHGALGFFGVKLLTVPTSLYKNYITCLFGLPQKGFYSADYYSFLPWFFLFLMGAFMHKAVSERGKMNIFNRKMLPFLSPVGRHSLVIYMAHQPLIYFVLMAVFKIIKI